LGHDQCDVASEVSARERYHSTPATHAAEIERSNRNNRRRAATKL